MRRFAFLAAGTLCGAAAFSQALTDCIDPDVLRGLLLQGTNPIGFTAALPSELATFKAPAQFSWIGSAERRNPQPLLRGLGDRPRYQEMVTAAYRVSLPVAAARAAAHDALAAAGWKVTSQILQSLRPTVFVPTDMTLPVEAYCLDGDAASLNANVVDGVTYVIVNITRGSGAAGGSTNVCNAPPPPPGLSMPALSISAILNPLEPYLPKLDAPPDPANRQPVAMHSGGGSLTGAPFTTLVRFTLKDSPVNVARHFARQMAQQGWTADSNWSGPTTAGSTWSKSAAADTPLHATLSVSALDDDQFAASLRVIRTR